MSQTDSGSSYELQVVEILDSPISEKEPAFPNLVLPENRLKSEEKIPDRSSCGPSPPSSFLANISQALSATSDCDSPVLPTEQSEPAEAGPRARAYPSIFGRNRALT